MSRVKSVWLGQAFWSRIRFLWAFCLSWGLVLTVWENPGERALYSCAFSSEQDCLVEWEEFSEGEKFYQFMQGEAHPSAALPAFAGHFAARTRTWGSDEIWSAGHQANIWAVWVPSCVAAPRAVGCRWVSVPAFAICLLQIQPNLAGASAACLFCLHGALLNETSLLAALVVV